MLCMIFTQLHKTKEGNVLNSICTSIFAYICPNLASVTIVSRTI